MSYSTEFYVFYGYAFPASELPLRDRCGVALSIENSDQYPDDVVLDIVGASPVLRGVGVRVGTWGDFWGGKTGRSLYVRASWTPQPSDDVAVTLPPIDPHWNAALDTACRALGIEPARRPAWQFVSITA